jgi:hypothetical protein
MPTTEHYQTRAEECRSHAREVGDTLERETLLRIAAMFARLAEHRSRKESENAPDDNGKAILAKVA